MRSSSHQPPEIDVASNVGYFLESLNLLKARIPGGFERVQYIEQPTAGIW